MSHPEMPKLVDTTIRLLSQDPLAGKLPTGEVLRIAEILDRAGFAYLEVSGGGVFDSAVRRAVESPWERIRAIDARTTTPLGLALRGRFLVGSRPVSEEGPISGESQPRARVRSLARIPPDRAWRTVSTSSLEVPDETSIWQRGSTTTTAVCERVGFDAFHFSTGTTVGHPIACGPPL